MKRSDNVPTLAVTALVDTVLCNCTGWEDPEGFEVDKYSFFGKFMFLSLSCLSIDILCFI